MTNSGIPQDAAEDGPYQQQLKNALLSGMRPEIKEWVTKHFVHLPTSTLPQFMDQVIRAEKVVQNKKKNREKKADVFVADSCDVYGGGDADVFYMEGPSRDNRRG